MRSPFPESLPPLVGLSTQRACQLLAHFGWQVRVQARLRPHDFPLKPLVSQDRAIVTTEKGYVVEVGFY